MLIAISSSRLYMAGVEPQIKNLYPKIEYPVSRGTAPLQQLVHWQHEHDMSIPKEGSEKSVSMFKTKLKSYEKIKN